MLCASLHRTPKTECSPIQCQNSLIQFDAILMPVHITSFIERTNDKKIRILCFWLFVSTYTRFSECRRCCPYLIMHACVSRDRNYAACGCILPRPYRKSARACMDIYSRRLVGSRNTRNGINDDARAASAFTIATHRKYK